MAIAIGRRQNPSLGMNMNIMLRSWHMVFFACLFLLGAFCLRVWIKLEKTDLGYRLARERNYTVKLDMERRELEMKLSVAKRPDVVRSRASQLGLHDADRSQITVINKKR